MLLEPIVIDRGDVPGEKFGDISADLSTRRGHITGMDIAPRRSCRSSSASVPLAEVLTYATARSRA